MFRTFIETDSLERASSGAIWGNVWHEMDGMHFPHGGWNDMIVPYVTALAEGVCEALSGGKAEVDFFDGPLGVEMLPVGPRIRIVAIVPEGSPGLAPCCTGRADLAADVLKQGELLLDACEQRGWSLDNDVRRLGLVLGWLREDLPPV
ncbi:hypothetical protein OG788_30825 [Streptomyces sp. NBC_00647]|uniref:hypothetical protein n=1 Tax=Streptomyces sp. NBC_00647 TaxID=2975796 RepID=UPI00324363F7